jgi:hypothetical protein
MNFSQKISKFDEYEQLIKNKLNEISKLRQIKIQLINSIMIDLNDKDKDLEIVTNNYNGSKFKKIVSKNFTPLSFSFVRECLSEIIPREDQIEKIINYIKSKRNFKIINDLKRIN